MVHAILESDKIPPSEKEFQRLFDEVFALIGAGSDTVSQMLTVRLFLGEGGAFLALMSLLSFHVLTNFFSLNKKGLIAMIWGKS